MLNGFQKRDLCNWPSDDNALAIDKVALLPGQTATFENYTNYVRGINAVFVDVNVLNNIDSITENDFVLRTGNGSSN